MVRFKLTIYTHGFLCKVSFHNDRSIVVSYCTTMNVYESRYNPKFKKVTRTFKQSYTVFIPRSVTYGLHINNYETFKEHLTRNRVSDTEIEITIVTPTEGEPVYNLELVSTVKLLEHQPPIVDFICSQGNTKVLPLQTGRGKTACSLYSIAKLQKRTVVIMGKMHVETWLKDARWMYTPESQNEIIVICGKGPLSKLIKSAQNTEILPSIIIITVATLRDYFTEYEQTNKSTYGCVPGVLYDTLGVGFRITDEAHQNLHFGFRNDILTNVHKALYLSATIESNDAFTNKLYDLIFPRTKRYTGLAWKKYCLVQAIGYRLNKPDLVHCTGGSGYYSHIAYEQWIQKDKGRLLSYLDMIYKIVSKGFLDKYQEKQKCIIFMSTIELCRTTAEYLQARIPQLTCADYTGEHEDIVLHTNDIIVSTPGSTGTGKDIKGLVMALNTVAISKREANIQILGRLREIEIMFPGVEPIFYYLVCIDIAKHLQYHNSRVDLFRQFAKNVNIVNSSFII